MFVVLFFYNSKHVNFCACLLSVMAMNVSRKVFGKLIASFITNVIVMEFYYLYYFIIIFIIIVIIFFSFSVGARLTVMMTLLLQ